MMESSWEVMVGGSAHTGVEHKTNHYISAMVFMGHGLYFRRARAPCLAQLWAKYRLLSDMSSPTISAERNFSQGEGLLYSCLLIARLPSRSRTLN